MTIRCLMKGRAQFNKNRGRIIVCSGRIMESLVLKLYPGVRTTTYDPQHAQGRLSNEFGCYANYECNTWLLNGLTSGDKTFQNDP